MTAGAVRVAKQRVILAMGGGGFTMEPANPLLDDFVLGLARSAEPRILFLPTASGDETARSMPSARDDAVQELRRVQRLRRGGDHGLAGGTRGRG